MPVTNEMLAELILVQTRNAVATAIMQEAGRLASLRTEPGLTPCIIQEDVDHAAIGYQNALNAMKRKGLWLNPKPE